MAKTFEQLVPAPKGRFDGIRRPYSPAEVEKLAVMDAFLPGVEGWEPIYNNPLIWHFRFNGPKPQALVAGGEQIYFRFFGTI